VRIATDGEEEAHLTPQSSEALLAMPVGAMIYPLLVVTNRVGLAVKLSSSVGFKICNASLQPAVCAVTLESE